jgi:hypothetical protein
MLAMNGVLRHGVAIGGAPGAFALLVAAGLATCSGTAPGEVGSMDPAQSEVRRTFARTPADVLDGTLALLVARGEMASAAASEWAPTGRRTLQEQGQVEMTGTSVSQPADTLRTHVVADQARLVGESGGRYWLTIRVVREGGASATVGVAAAIVATTPGPGPLGGRPVASNGTLERGFLDALAAALAREGGGG